jgi:hypothetical protein
MNAKWLVALLLFGTSGLAWAEGGCPSGMIPHRGTDITSCGPIPQGYYGNDNSIAPRPVDPPVRWTDTWGAITVDNALSKVGVVTDQPNKRAAEKAAAADCRARGGTNCVVKLAYYNQCAVIVWGDQGYNIAAAATAVEATEIGMKSCGKADANCQVFYTGCSFAKRL